MGEGGLVILISCPGEVKLGANQLGKHLLVFPAQVHLVFKLYRYYVNPPYTQQAYDFLNGPVTEESLLDQEAAGGTAGNKRGSSAVDIVDFVVIGHILDQAVV